MILFALIAVNLWEKAFNSLFFEKLGLEKKFENYFVTALFLTVIFVFTLRLFESYGYSQIEQEILSAEAF